MPDNSKKDEISHYELLANAIIIKAADDYREARKMLSTCPSDYSALCIISDVERFFQSQWYSVLSRTDGKKILSMLNREYDNEF